MAHVMIVDDDEDFASAAATGLRAAGHRVQIELETSAALRSMTQRAPDLVILDVMFPESSSAGFDLARQMRETAAKLGAIPVLMLTAVNQRFPLGFSARDIDDEWLPVHDFLEKPVDIETLRSKVAAMLAGGGRSPTSR